MQNVTSLFVRRAISRAVSSKTRGMEISHVSSYYFRILHMGLICHTFGEVLCHGLLITSSSNMQGRRGYFPRVVDRVVPLEEANLGGTITGC